MILVSRAKSFEYVLALYFLTGIGSGASNVPVMGLVSHWFASTVRGRAAGFIVIGSGFAIVISGKLYALYNVELPEFHASVARYAVSRFLAFPEFVR